MGLIIIALLLVFIGACLLPWWFIPACIIVGLVSFYLEINNK